MTAAAMVTAENVHKSFGHVKVLKGIDLEVAPKDVFCLLGPSGSGKSTFLRCINHLENIDGGRLYVPEPDGKTITVYDTATNAKVGSFITDNQANTSFRGIYFAPNGTLYIADPGDNTLYAVTIGGATVV